jgi:hypothetical protein
VVVSRSLTRSAAASDVRAVQGPCHVPVRESGMRQQASTFGPHGVAAEGSMRRGYQSFTAVIII